ncbi:MAG: SMC-Scp complex subunit ScpB [Candidatus Paceibacterota bacterium]|jgi:segregation and condensation protein B
MTLDAQIESILFFKGEPISREKLATTAGASVEDTNVALVILEEKLSGRGLSLVYKENEVMLGTAPENSDIIEKITKDELMRDLGKAGLETLSIILYRGPVARREIDYIRGVNSNFILRNLMIRGLVEKVQNETDQRQFLYKPTFELLQYLGVQKLEDLPEFSAVKTEIENYKKQNEENVGEENISLPAIAEENFPQVTDEISKVQATNEVIPEATPTRPQDEQNLTGI